ncbi:MAG: sulfite exporter TauE/SafE family protein [Myxococcales bacterium]|nr:sulfite exporter TauE/SafE family protein [Myxococcales bacterium]
MLAGVDGAFLAVAALVLLSFTSAALAGFGGVVIAMTLAAQLKPLEWLLPRLVSLNLLLVVYLVARHRAHVDGRALLRQILPFMGLGTALGFLGAGLIPGTTAKMIFGAFVVAVSARELANLLGWVTFNPQPLTPARRAGWTFAAGLVHGVFASGGPLLVYTLSRTGLPKAAFRATLAAVWLILNSALMVGFIAKGRMDARCLQDVLLLLPILLVATVLGEWGHHRIDERRFRVVTFSLLLVAGGALFIH